jgi:hypothetical protein
MLNVSEFRYIAQSAALHYSCGRKGPSQATSSEKGETVS